MEYTLEGIESFKNSPLLRLLKSDSAVLVFLHKIFVEEKKESISEPELVKRWEIFQLVQLRMAQIGDCRIQIKSWLDEKHMWLENRIEDDGVVYYSITPIVETAFNVFEMVTDNNSAHRSLSTESSYTHMVSAVRDLSRRMDTDRNRRIKYHKDQIRFHTKMLKQLQEGGEIEGVDKADFVKNLQFIINILQQNPADFRRLATLYRNFYQEMIDYIYKELPVKGTLLQYFAERSDEIDSDVVGRIYRSFIEISFDGNNDEIDKALRQFEESPHYSKELFPERPVVLFSKLRMTVRIVNDEIKKIIKNIHAYCSSHDVKKDQEIRDAIFNALAVLEKYCYEKDMPVLVHRSPRYKFICPLSNTLSFEENKRGGGIRISSGGESKLRPEAPALEVNFIDSEKLRNNLKSMTKDGKKVLLSELVTAFPPIKGIQEVFAYFTFIEDFKFKVLYGNAFKFDFVMSDTNSKYQDLTYDVEFERRSDSFE